MPLTALDASSEYSHVSKNKRKEPSHLGNRVYFGVCN